MSLDHVPLRRALLSVSDKTGIVELARSLAARGVELLSTGGTAKALRDAGLVVKDVAELTSFPEMLDGRVKTLHPKIHGGLLGRRDDPSHVAQLAVHGIATIDIVIVNLYPFERIAGQMDAGWEELIENIDIGGPAMIRSAAKNHDGVCVVVDPVDYPQVQQHITATGGTLHSLRRSLAIKAFARTAAYDAAIAQRLARKFELEQPSSEVPSRLTLPPVVGTLLHRITPLRYGENPHQGGAVYAASHDATDGIGLATAVPLQGKELSYNNLLDADAAIFSLRSLVDGAADGHGVVIIKHNTPCGAARASSLLAAYEQAFHADKVSAFGGIVAVSSELDGAGAMAMADLFLEVVVAPSFSAEAREVFAKKPQVRLLALPNLLTAALPQLSWRSVAGGMLVQHHDRIGVDVRTAKVVSKRQPTASEWSALDVAWRMCAAVKSNAITIARADVLLSAGGGQTSRVDSARIAVQKAATHHHNIKGAAAGSDAFFPFPDGVEVLAEAGITAIAQPGGSKRDDQVIAVADKHNIAMVLTGMRHFRH